MTIAAQPQMAQRPQTTIGPRRWLRKNLFRSPLDTLLTLITFGALAAVSIRFFSWAITEAQWAVVTKNFRGLMQGTYPIEQGWRLALSVAIVVGLAGISWGLWGRMFRRTAIMLIGAAMVCVVVPLVDPSWWGTSTFGMYLTAQVLPLLDVLRMPVMLLIAGLLIAYGIGRLARSISAKYSGRVVMGLWFLSIPFIFILVRGISPDTPGLPLVSTDKWGGLLLTFMLAFVTIVCCFPFGILLALGRVSGRALQSRKWPPRWWLSPREWGSLILSWWRAQGNYPIIKIFCTVYIEVLRGVPLVAVFFTASTLVPFALGNAEIDGVVRAMVAMTMFEAAYIAEIVRGGLQAIPPGQVEAARALGLNSVYTTVFITLPQALRYVIPALVGQFITMFKDTSLVYAVGLLDLLGTVESILPKEEFARSRREAFVFIALIYFVFSYGMSYAARQLERSGSGRIRRIG